MRQTAPRRARILITFAACLCAAAHAEPLAVEPATVTSGKAETVRVTAPGPGAVMLIPGGPHVTAELPWPDNRVLALDPARGLVYRVDADALEVVAVRPPHAPIGRYRADAAIVALKRQGSSVLLTLADGGVVELDVRDPRAPQPVRRYALPEAGPGVALAGDYLYQATGRDELLVWDVAAPAAPRLVARQPTTGPAHDVDLAEGRAYVAQGEAGLLILDVQDPARPRWLGSTGRLGDLVKVVARGDSVWVATAASDISRVDVFNAAQPGVAARQTLTGQALQALAADGGEVWAATATGLTRIAFDVEPPLLGNAELDVGRGVNYGGQRRADVVGDRVYVADWFAGLHIYEVDDAGLPRLLGSLHTPGSAKGVVVRGDHAYVADDDHGLAVVDVRDPRRPRIVATLATPGLAYTPKLAGDLLYLASHRGGFQIIDVGEPTTPRLVADVATPGLAWSLAVSDDRLYVADDAAGLLIYDVRDPAAPRPLGGYDNGGRLEEVLVRDGLAYLAYFDQGLKLVDVSDPAAPRPVAELATPGNARGLDLVGDTLYVADWLAGVHAIDVAEPARPQLLASYDTPGAAWGLRVRGDDVYVLDWWGGFGVLELSAAGPPRYRRYAARGVPQQVAAAGDYLYVAHGDGGLQVFDIKNPLNPTWVTGVELARPARLVAVDGGAAYVGLADGGIAVVDITSPFEARVVTELETAQTVEHLHLAGTRLYAQGPGHGWAYELAAPLAPRLIAHARGVPGPLWSAGGRLYATSGAEDWARAGVEVQTLSQPAAILRGRDRLYAAIDAGRRNELSLYQDHNGRLMKLTSVSLGARLTDLAWGDGVLYVASGMGLVSFDMNDPTRPAVVAIQDGIGDGRIIAHRGVLYSGLDALRPSPPLTAAVGDDGRAELALPAGLAAGGYDLLYKPVQGAMQSRHNALTVAAPRFAKPKITPEQFQRLLQQHRAREGGSPAGATPPP